MTVVLPINLPRQQLPQPTDRLSDGFLHALPAPIGLWTPSKLAQAAADFTPLPQKHFGALNGGITTVPGGFGTLGTAWKLNGTSGYVNYGDQPAYRFASGQSFSFAFVLSANTTQATDRGIVTKGYDGIGFATNAIPWYLVRWNDTAGKIDFFLRNSSSTNYDLPSTTAVSDGLPHLWVVVYDAAHSQQRIYLDGKPAGVANSVGADAYGTNGAPLIWGVHAGGYLNGAFNFKTCFRSALTDAQVSTLYTCLLTGEPFPLFQPQTTELFAGAGAVVTSKVPWPLFFGRAA